MGTNLSIKVFDMNIEITTYFMARDTLTFTIIHKELRHAVCENWIHGLHLGSLINCWVWDAEIVDVSRLCWE